MNRTKNSTKKISIPTIILVLLLTLTACMTDTPPRIVGESPSRSAPTRMSPPTAYEEPTPEDNSPVPLTVLYKQGTAERAMFEPAYGVYLGAWLHPGANIRMFENQAGRSHAVYVHEMHLGDDVPINWLLSSIAALATPMLIIHPPRLPQEEDGTPHGDLVIYLAHRLGVFNLPMFVAFYPLAGARYSMDATEYTLMFRYARAVFLAYAPLTAFVWVAPNTYATPQSPMYPGHDAVDWVGVPLLAAQGGDGFSSDILADFEPFYMAFQAHKPIMVLPLGISHFSRVNYTYNMREAEAEIARVYEALQAGFPRVGMIVYGDASSISSQIAPQDSFAISVENSLMQAYENAISHENFLSVLEKDAPPSTRWVRSAFHGYHWEGVTYLNPATIEQEIAANLPRTGFTEINGHNYVDISRITNKTITVDLEQGVIFIAS